MRTRLIESISREEQRDGMDGILLCIDKSSGRLTYSAANNNPVIIRNKQVIEMPYDKMPVGKGEKYDSFKLYDLPVEKGDMIYLYTDGYADQFGGVKGKKFKYKQLNELLTQISVLPLKEQEETLDREFESWRGALEQVDDVCIIGIRV